MIMGRIMGNLKPYTRTEYVSALTITAGIAIFMINQTKSVSKLFALCVCFDKTPS